MSFYLNVMLQGYANTESAESFKKHFERYCDWCWGHGYGNCDNCRKQYMKVYVPLKIREKQKELGLNVTK